MRYIPIAVVAATLSCHGQKGPRPSSCGSDWSQWGLSGTHAGTSCATAQPISRALVDVVYDPFTEDEMREAGGALVAHFQSPLISGDDVFMVSKQGTYQPCTDVVNKTPAPCGPNAWDTQVWTERKYHWTSGDLELQWQFESTWKPPPNGGSIGGWEPVFHAALGLQDLWVPMAGGAVAQVDSTTGSLRRLVDPFSGDPDTYVAGPVTVDASGNAVWNVIRFNSGTTAPWSDDAHGAVVRATPAGAVNTVATETLIASAPAPTDACELSYAYNPQNPPPFPLVDASGNPLPPPTNTCGSQRPALNGAPATAQDGTIYVVTRAHRNARYGYLVALTPALTVAWASSFRGLVNDGCGVTVPKDGLGGHCRVDAPDGIDPATGRAPAMRVDDTSTASPVVLPDGSVAIGTLSIYNGFRGHLMKFDSAGKYLTAFDFGWDVTPAVFAHDGTYSLVVKDNHYVDSGPFYITQLDANLKIEWQYQSKSTQSCARRPDGSIACVDDGEHPNGFEWCVNALAVDAQGVVYANSEDGSLYAIDQGGDEKQHLFLASALEAAYTPMAIDAKGRVYTQNKGHLYVVGGD